MATVILVRHGQSTANAAGILAGRADGVTLDETGRAQALRMAERLAPLSLARVVSSPIARCRETARFILEHQASAVPESLDDDLTEADYGEWQGRKLSELVGDPLWPVVQRTPSQATFPGGESMSAMQARAVAAVRRRDASFGEKDLWAAVSHADIIKSILADALGMHLDQFQRIHVAPASVSIIRYGDNGPEVLATNSFSGELPALGS